MLDLKCNDFCYKLKLSIVVMMQPRSCATYVCFTYVCRCCIHRGLSIVEQHTECRKGKNIKKEKKRLKSRLKRARKRERKKKFGNAAYCYCAAAAANMLMNIFTEVSVSFQMPFPSLLFLSLLILIRICIYILKLCKNYKKNVILRKRHCRCYKFYTRNSFFSVYKNENVDFS